jgi:hypothetical protein
MEYYQVPRTFNSLAGIKANETVALNIGMLSINGGVPINSYLP